MKGLESKKGRNSFCIHHLSPFKSENKKNPREENPNLYYQKTPMALKDTDNWGSTFHTGSLKCLPVRLEGNWRGLPWPRLAASFSERGVCGRGTGNVDNQLAPHLMSGQRRDSSGEHQRVLLGRAENSSEGGQRGTCACLLWLSIKVCRFWG